MIKVPTKTMESTTITSLLSPLSSYSFANGKRSSPMTNVDTALGAAVTIGFSLTILRLTSQTLRQHKDIKNHYGEHNLKRSWFVSFVQAILIRTLFQKGIEKDSTNKALQEGDAYFSILRNSMKISQDDVEGIYVGSCHCQSIGYTLKVKGNLEALDCTGKIRYPHVVTKASSFQLTKGSKNLGMYYVSLPLDHSKSSPSPHLKQAGMTITAAHAFCKRCGVHIFRAPDSRTNILEVNVNCLDSSSTNGRDALEKLQMSFYDSNQKLGGGIPIENQWNKKQHQVEYEDNKQNPFVSSSTGNRDDTGISSPSIQKYYDNLPLSPTETVSTAFLSSSAQSFLTEQQRSDQESSSMDSSSNGSNISNPLLYASSISNQNNIHHGFGHWTTTSPSVQALSTNINTPIVSGKAPNERIKNVNTSIEPSIHTPILQHQLKYYMKRHLKTEGEQER